MMGGAGLALIAALYRALVAVALDEDGARVSGLPVGTLNVVVAGLAGVTIALSMRIVGILLIAALMVLPVTAAGRLARSVAWTFALSMAIGLGSVFVGLTISYYADLAPGGAIVLVAAGAYVAAATGARLASRA
jgi:zinc transport system permease protein